MALEEQVKTLLKENLNLFADPVQITKLFGHASYRTYYRVALPDRSTYVLMEMPEGVSSVSEEITNYAGPKAELPFLNVQRYLKKQGLPVPGVSGFSRDAKLILLEDVGDRHLETYLKDSNEPLRISFYKRAVDLLVEMQAKTSRPGPCIAFERSFDETLLNWEFDHFLEYGIEDRFRVKIPDDEKKIFTEATRKISREISQSPYRFVHRDFQSRNLILKDYNIFILDFQDALLGPEPYDLVSLTRDSYIELSWDAVDQLIAHYLEKRTQAQIPVADRNAFRRLFDLVTLQRKLKDTGRFQFIHTIKKNSNFLVNVPASLRYVKEAFTHLPEFKTLQEWIGHYVPELK